jgi:uncharacterized phage infection (PIP) family protein YhgE
MSQIRSILQQVNKGMSQINSSVQVNRGMSQINSPVRVNKGMSQINSSVQVNRGMKQINSSFQETFQTQIQNDCNYSMNTHDRYFSSKKYNTSI